MGTIETVGYVGDWEIICCACARKEYAQDCKEPINFQGTFISWLKANSLHVVTDQEDFGPAGYYCDCGNAIQEGYCPECGNATGGIGGELCDNCMKKESNETVGS